MPKKTASESFPTTIQKKYEQPGSDLGSTNAVPRCTEYDMAQGEHGRGVGVAGMVSSIFECCKPKEQTFTAPKRGNKVTKGGNY